MIKPLSLIARDKLMSKRAVTLFGEIENESVTDVINRLTILSMENEQKPITLLISSGGGVVDCGLELAEFIDHILNTPVRAVVLQECISTATLPFIACSERLAFYGSLFCIHSNSLEGISIHSGANVDGMLEEIKNNLLYSREIMIAFYAKHLQLTPAKVDELMALGDREIHDRLSATEAQKLGIVTRVINEKGVKLLL